MSDTTPERIEPALLTIPQVCAYLNIASPTFYKINATGAFGLLRVPLCSKVLFSRMELEAWVRAGCPHRNIWQTMKKEMNMEHAINKRALSKRAGAPRNKPQRKEKGNRALSIWTMTKGCVKEVTEKACQILSRSFWEAFFDRVLPK